MPNREVLNRMLRESDYVSHIPHLPEAVEAAIRNLTLEEGYSRDQAEAAALIFARAQKERANLDDYEARTAISFGLLVVRSLSLMLDTGGYNV